MKFFQGKKWIGPLVCTVLINGLAFTGIPFLSHERDRHETDSLSRPFFLTMSPPPAPRETERTPPRPKERPKHVPVMTLQPRKTHTPPPQDAIQTVRFDFQIQPKLDLGLAVPAPPPVPHPVGPAEFSMDQVDQAPQILRQVMPRYPFGARQKNLTGRVVLRFLVDTDGRVRSPSIVETQPEGVFGSSALEAIRKWRFKPGYYQGEPVSTWVILPIEFRLAGR